MKMEATFGMSGNMRIPVKINKELQGYHDRDSVKNPNGCCLHLRWMLGPIRIWLV